MTGAKILGFGGYQPDRVVTNDDLAKLVDTNDEWIRTRVGIQERRFARDDETVADMAEAAGAKALAASGLEPSDIDLVTVATCSPESLMPTVSATVAYRLGIVAPGAYDLNAACAGFCYAVGAAADSVRAGSVRNALVIGAEKMTSWMDWSDRSTCIIFADGAGRGRGRADRGGRAVGNRAHRVGQRGRPGAQDRHRGADGEADPGRPGRVPLGHHGAGPGGA